MRVTQKDVQASKAYEVVGTVMVDEPHGLNTIKQVLKFVIYVGGEWLLVDADDAVPIDVTEWDYVPAEPEEEPVDTAEPESI